MMMETLQGVVAIIAIFNAIIRLLLLYIEVYFFATPKKLRKGKDHHAASVVCGVLR